MVTDPMQEAIRIVGISRPYTRGNFTELLCGHTIWADPRWSETALAAAIRDHRAKMECGGPRDEP